MPVSSSAVIAMSCQHLQGAEKVRTELWWQDRVIDKEVV